MKKGFVFTNELVEAIEKKFRENTEFFIENKNCELVYNKDGKLIFVATDDDAFLTISIADENEEYLYLVYKYNRLNTCQEDEDEDDVLIEKDTNNIMMCVPGALIEDLFTRDYIDKSDLMDGIEEILDLFIESKMTVSKEKLLSFMSIIVKLRCIGPVVVYPHVAKEYPYVMCLLDRIDELVKSEEI